MTRHTSAAVHTATALEEARRTQIFSRNGDILNACAAAERARNAAAAAVKLTPPGLCLWGDCSTDAERAAERATEYAAAAAAIG